METLTDGALVQEERDYQLLTVRVTRKFLAQIRRAARSQNLTMSAMVRLALAEKSAGHGDITPFDALRDYV